MDNPYQPPTAPLVTGAGDEPADRAVTIDTPKGPMRLEMRGLVIVLAFGDGRKEIPADKFGSSIILHFGRTKRISFKIYNVFAVTVSEEKFREVLDFYGIDRFKERDQRSQRMLHLFFGALFLFLGGVNTNAPDARSLYDFGLIGFGILSLVLFALTFTRLYLAFCLISACAYLLLGGMMVFLWYTQGDWWVFFVLFFIYFSLSNSLERFFYFRRTGDSDTTP